ncbi:hypothetical protein KC327_g13271 [Hortaea werneckii]|uniref:RING-type domain-containing protein n=1 Tax=Hortaea werneckii EXF-2000 TaxID=1157616 RepID=A0A1Z5SLD5_HORWE|nr:hypothetical protein KC358_g13177 [Hortaea werneckii]OTA18674.1 hypothetical protein BTJ68_15442 [Hortaea werneckii EXF-2000]KAI6835063.1 hypothetical protein KC350_g6594 [Hortaea werneckii]KAI6909720.1 hypothetical protein KC348_g13416 [Hortaea werneckii]KAI6935770.1 hypothetical protein KC341_g6678 [Hortaea werneckii]
MSATSLQILTLELPNPETNPTGDYHQVNHTYAYESNYPDNIRTLSTNGVASGSDVTGLLYVPTVEDEDCRNASEEYVYNTTRFEDIPRPNSGGNYDLVALAPWLSPNCVQSYLRQARQDPGVQGFLFFLPDSGSGEPPDMNSNEWWLGEGGTWKRQNDYPVYALPGSIATSLLGVSRMYSGNMSSVPFGEELTDTYDPDGYIRLFVDIDTAGSGTQLPSLWIFLLIVLGVLISVVAVTSLTMHFLQRRRRMALRRRVANGEVDLEALGIKRLTVPQDILDKMPLYKYGSTGELLPPSAAAAVAANAKEGVEADKLESASSSRPSSPAPDASPTPARRGHRKSRQTQQQSFRPTQMSQPTCAICLDDYVPVSAESEGTTVRELPCHHIFHPECVDAFLKENSSLCPICKRTVLPQGYCPRNVTNAMVRRERIMNHRRARQQQRNAADQAESQRDDATDPPPPPTGLAGLGHRIRNISGSLGLRPTSRPVDRRVVSAPPASGPNSSQPMTDLPPPEAPAPALTRSNSASTGDVPSRAQSNTTVQPDSTPGRREWARQRAVNMLGRRAAPPEGGGEDGDEEDRTPRWRKVFRGVFPGFGR